MTASDTATVRCEVDDGDAPGACGAWTFFVAHTQAAEGRCARPPPAKIGAEADVGMGGGAPVTGGCREWDNEFTGKSNRRPASGGGRRDREHARSRRVRPAGAANP
jgi:hypothetical protein